MRDGSIYKTPKFNLQDLTKIPFPDYSIYEDGSGKIDINNIASNRLDKKILPVMTGRGCIYNCTYCSNSTLRKMWPNKKSFMRKYDLDEFIDELVRLKNKYDVEYFELWDELFLGDVPYALAFFELYKQKLGIPFSFLSRIEVMNYDVCKKAADAGCEAIYFGLESGNEEYRRKYLKRFDKNQQIIDAAENCKKVGIKRVTFNIIGMPFETESEMLDTLNLNKEISPDYFYIFTYIPLKGTKLYEIAEDAGLLYDSLRTIHYTDNMFSGKVRMNIKQIGNSATEEEFRRVSKLMVDFQNTREISSSFNKYEEGKIIDSKYV
ncbi:MAG: radical SAM protein [Flavobacteriales bacterium]|nr:radical SAM protein [Flavobacteriales bacterium]